MEINGRSKKVKIVVNEIKLTELDFIIQQAGSLFKKKFDDYLGCLDENYWNYNPSFIIMNKFYIQKVRKDFKVI